MADKLDAKARPHALASRTSGTRTSGQILWIIVHDTEGGTAASVADFFHSTAAMGSSHLVSDDHETFRCLPDSAIPWAAPGANENGLHIELCGFAKWSSKDWTHHETELGRAAFQVSEWCKEYGIPARKLTPQQLRARVQGIAGHLDVTNAWHLTTHTDPGSGFPWAHFIDLVNGYLKPTPIGPRFHVQQPKGDGTFFPGKWLNKSGLDDYAGDVIAAHSGDAEPFVYQVTFDQKGEPPEGGEDA